MREVEKLFQVVVAHEKDDKLGDVNEAMTVSLSNLPTPWPSASCEGTISMSLVCTELA